MEITDLNNQKDIGANCIFAQIGEFRMLVDVGIDPKEKGLSSLPNFDLIEDNSLDFIIITHAHLDHCSALPVIAKRQPQANILVTDVNKDIIPRMLINSVSVMKKQRQEFAIKEYPLYSTQDVDQIIKPRLLEMPFNRTRRFEYNGDFIEITFLPAGHIAGAASVKIEHKKRKILFTGDISFKDQLTLKGASFPKEKYDTLVMETTRGLAKRVTEFTRQEEIERFLAEIQKSLLAGGNVLIASFALGRAQEIMAIILKAFKEKVLPKVPVYSTGLGLDLVDYLDKASRVSPNILFRKNIAKELGVKRLKGDLKPGQDLDGSSIFILGSGMMVEKTPSYKLAASLLDFHKNAILFPGYCDPDSPAGKLLLAKKSDSFVFEDLNYTATINASIEKFDLSGHADKEELYDFAIKADPRAIVLTHGSSGARDWFLDEFAMNGDNIKIVDPEPGKTYNI